MSEAVIRSVPRIVLRAEAESLVARLNRIALTVSLRIEAVLEGRRERRLLEAMSDRELSDIGIGPGQTGGAFRGGRG